MTETREKTRVAWYRVPVPREELSRLNRRSDLLGLAQSLGYLGLLAATVTLAIYGSRHWPWPIVVAIIFFHGMCWNFMVNGFHELVHESVFKTRWLNGLFLRILSFLGWYNHHGFWASHTEHHKFTLHPPDDLEVVLPIKITLKSFAKNAIVNPWALIGNLKTHWRYARGKLRGEWEHALFDDKPERARELFNWSRFLLAGQAAIVIVSLIMHWWMVPVVTVLAPYYGGWLFYLCNNSQHVGLKDYSPDFRECCRTIYLNPFVRFLYWHMNYHTEHHMYAAVPCYNLGKLHHQIKADMPACPNGLYATWKQIAMIMQRQKTEPGYQYMPDLPPRRGRIGAEGKVDEAAEQV